MAHVGVYKTNGEGGHFLLTFTVKDGTRSHLLSAHEADILAQNIKRRLGGRATLSTEDEDDGTERT